MEVAEEYHNIYRKCPMLPLDFSTKLSLYQNEQHTLMASVNMKHDTLKVWTTVIAAFCLKFFQGIWWAPVSVPQWKIDILRTDRGME